MDGLGDEERQRQFDEILKLLEENGGEMSYKEVNEILSHKFEGVRLVLKAMKDQGLVDFDGMVPSFDGMISITSD